ncbi:VOC family protein [Roseovarius sp. BRH_c41]|uniref:VOC family protein n=1 Tax=Roseovarius sp. BRH_c41 TaxID=1629709 RepID=UPI0005F17BB7|nr:VOC family protein [Roseovarius sp. BRH_c41]KJS45770.1 MAG: glyoxalase [Roseovarius sp. BRH_c41]
MTFAISPLVPELWCSDFEVSMAFYTNVLGFEVAQQRGGDPHAYLTLHGAQIMLAHWKLDGNWVPWQPDQLDHPYGRGVNFQFMVPNVDKMYEAVLAHGTKPFLDIYEADIWRTDRMDTRCQFMILDPDGYVLRFAQSLRSRPVDDTDHTKLDEQYGVEAPWKTGET